MDYAYEWTYLYRLMDELLLSGVTEHNDVVELVIDQKQPTQLGDIIHSIRMNGLLFLPVACCVGKITENDK